MVLRWKKPKLCMLLKKYKDLKPQLVPWVQIIFPFLLMMSSLSFDALPLF